MSELGLEESVLKELSIRLITAGTVRAAIDQGISANHQLERAAEKDGNYELAARYRERKRLMIRKKKKLVELEQEEGW